MRLAAPRHAGKTSHMARCRPTFSDIILLSAADKQDEFSKFTAAYATTQVRQHAHFIHASMCFIRVVPWGASACVCIQLGMAREARCRFQKQSFVQPRRR